MFPQRRLAKALFSTLHKKQVQNAAACSLDKIRNIGISAHIDSGKTTLTERILFYTGRISSIHEVKGRDGIGATMDSMDLEREKGITIQSAATHCTWKGYHINLIDTPGHVDFTIEVERALRVLDGAILVLCGVSGVQSQTITVDRQMRRYGVPRIAFINKLDRSGANPWSVIDALRGKLKLNASAVQIPIGLEQEHRGIVDIIGNEATFFDGKWGEQVRTESISSEYEGVVEKKRRELLESLASVDEEMGEYFLNEQFPPKQALKEAIRRCCIKRTFLPVFMGSALGNCGVQPLLDGVSDYLPDPTQVECSAFDCNTKEKVVLEPNIELPLVALAFKLEESRFGQLTYMRVYQGRMYRGQTLKNNNSSSRPVKVPRLVRMHANQMEDVTSVGAGEICAIFGVECHSGDTFTDSENPLPLSLAQMHIPEPVISLSIKPTDRNATAGFSKGLARFQREDPTFKVSNDFETGETLISGMGELHLEIYAERMKREYECPVALGRPRVAYRECIGSRAAFDYTHKKQSGGAGQYGRVVGYIEPLENECDKSKVEFKNEIVGGVIPTNLIPSVENGFRETAAKGIIAGYPMIGFRVVLTDGQSHVVDSNDLAFTTAAVHALKQAVPKAQPYLLEPVMKVCINCPTEYQGAVLVTVTKRRGIISDTSSNEIEKGETSDLAGIVAFVPLAEMFGYATELRSITAGKGEFTMEYERYLQVPSDIATKLIEAARESKDKALTQENRPKSNKN